jgi:hypothetical protein
MPVANGQDARFFVDLSQHRVRKTTAEAVNSLFSINKIVSPPHDAISSNSIRTEERREKGKTTMAKAAAKTKTAAAKKKAPAAKKPAAKKTAAKKRA